MCIFAAEWFILSVNFFTARDGVVMFSHNFKQFCILVQIATKGPDLLQNRSQKVPILPESPFFSPITTYFSTKSRWQNFVTQPLQMFISRWSKLPVPLCLFCLESPTGNTMGFLAPTFYTKTFKVLDHVGSISLLRWLCVYWLLDYTWWTVGTVSKDSYTSEIYEKS